MLGIAAMPRSTGPDAIDIEDAAVGESPAVNPLTVTAFGAVALTAVRGEL
jgi:hypothetical protein